MEKFLRSTYAVVILALAALLIYYFIGYRVTVNDVPPKVGCEQLRAVGEDQTPGKPWKGEVAISGVTGKYCHLIFYTIHQKVEVYQGDELIYSMTPSPKNAFAKTPGNVWNDVLLTEDMNGSLLRVELSPIYSEFTYDLPEFWIGEKGDIVLTFLKRQLFTVIASLMLIFVGLVMMGYVFYNRRNSEVDKNMALLGGLASLVGLWRASDCSLAKLMLPGLPIISLIPFIAMMLVVIPFVMFMRSLYRSKGSKIWYVPCWFSLGLITLSLFLQYFNLADFRHNLLLIQISILLAIAVVIFMAIWELKRSGWNDKLRRNLLGMAVVVLGVFADIGTYYVSKGKSLTSFVIIGFLLYSIALGISVFKESGDLITAGKGAQNFENLAYHDKLTGLFNRAAFIMDTDPYVIDPENYVVAVLDLNNLKYCNDHLGHEMGDKYIRDSAQIIRNTFGTIGNCYRMGGDEFYCLIPKGGKASCREQQAEMERQVEEYNAKSEDVKIGIACGLARYDVRIDYDLNATAKRADQLMYQNKEEMKKK